MSMSPPRGNRRVRLLLFLMPLVMALTVPVYTTLAANTPQDDLIRRVLLTPEDLPQDYTLTAGMAGDSSASYARSFYNSMSEMGILYPAAVGKAFQGIVDGRGQGGTIFYFQYQEPPKDVVSFLQGYLWGKGGKPSRSHPEVIGTCGRLLVIWYFSQDSPIPAASRKKIESQLGEAMVVFKGD